MSLCLQDEYFSILGQFNGYRITISEHIHFIIFCYFQTASSTFEDNVRLWESQRTSEYNPSPGKSSSYSFNDQNVRRSNQFAHNPTYQDTKSNFSPNPRLR